MRAFGWCFVAVSLLAAGDVSAKDMFTLNGSGKSGVTLHVSVSSNPREGYIRGAGDYSHGETHNLGAVNCGRTERYFEVWSRRNFSTSRPPGVPVGKLQATFSLIGGNGSVVVQRDVKSTLKTPLPLERAGLRPRHQPRVQLMMELEGTACGRDGGVASVGVARDAEA